MTNTPSFIRRTPPALFPCLLGFLGLGLAWRRMGDLGAPNWIGEFVCLLATLLFAGTFICYLTKVCIRPSVVLDDLKIGPARGAVSAGSMCLMLVSLIVLPYSMFIAQIIWWSGVVLHALYLLAVIKTLRSIKQMRRSITPVVLLPFVGIIVASIGGPLMINRLISITFLIFSIPFFIWIVLESVNNARVYGVEKPQRPSFAIILAPVSVFALASHYIWPINVFYWFWFASLFTAVLLTPLLRWTISGGWSPSWGAFTFPIAAFSNVMIAGAVSGFGWSAWAGLIIGLGVSTALIPYVVYRTYRLWAAGKLAELSKAAIA